VGNSLFKKNQIVLRNWTKLLLHFPIRHRSVLQSQRTDAINTIEQGRHYARAVFSHGVADCRKTIPYVTHANLKMERREEGVGGSLSWSIPAGEVVQYRPRKELLAAASEGDVGTSGKRGRNPERTCNRIKLKFRRLSRTEMRASYGHLRWRLKKLAGVRNECNAGNGLEKDKALGWDHNQIASDARRLVRTTLSCVWQYTRRRIDHLNSFEEEIKGTDREVYRRRAVLTRLRRAVGNEISAMRVFFRARHSRVSISKGIIMEGTSRSEILTTGRGPLQISSRARRSLKTTLNGIMQYGRKRIERLAQFEYSVSGRLHEASRKQAIVAQLRGVISRELQAMRVFLDQRRIRFENIAQTSMDGAPEASSNATVRLSHQILSKHHRQIRKGVIRGVWRYVGRWMDCLAHFEKEMKWIFQKTRRCQAVIRKLRRALGREVEAMNLFLLRQRTRVTNNETVVLNEISENNWDIYILQRSQVSCHQPINQTGPAAQLPRLLMDTKGKEKEQPRRYLSNAEVLTFKTQYFTGKALEAQNNKLGLRFDILKKKQSDLRDTLRALKEMSVHESGKRARERYISVRGIQDGIAPLAEKQEDFEVRLSKTTVKLKEMEETVRRLVKEQANQGESKLDRDEMVIVLRDAVVRQSKRAVMAGPKGSPVLNLMNACVSDRATTIRQTSTFRAFSSFVVDISERMRASFEIHPSRYAFEHTKLSESCEFSIQFREVHTFCSALKMVPKDAKTLIVKAGTARGCTNPTAVRICGVVKEVRGVRVLVIGKTIGSTKLNRSSLLYTQNSTRFEEGDFVDPFELYSTEKAAPQRIENAIEEFIGMPGAGDNTYAITWVHTAGKRSKSNYLDNVGEVRASYPTVTLRSPQLIESLTSALDADDFIEDRVLRSIA